MTAALLCVAAALGGLALAFAVTVFVRAWRRDHARTRDIRRRVDRVLGDRGR